MMVARCFRISVPIPKRGGARRTTLALLLGLSGAAALLPLSMARAEQVRCLLEVNGRSYLGGPCNIDRESDGGFSIGTGPRGVGSPYFAYVFMQGDGTAQGFWNETKGTEKAQSPLGTLKRDGACWSNAKAKICAWK